MNSFLKTSADIQLIHNNKIIDESSIDAIYDGKDLNIAANSNENVMYMQLNNDEIMRLLAMPASHLDLEQRLKRILVKRKENTHHHHHWREKSRMGM